MSDFFEFLRLLRHGQYTGDAVILKSSFGKFEPSPDLHEYFRERGFRLPDFSRQDFGTMPAGSLGRGYSEFMAQYHLTPFLFSGRYQDRVPQHILPIYYSAIHDLIHVLTGFDTSFAGEAGVWGVMAGQNISPQVARALTMARWLFPIARPHQFSAIQAAANEGFRIGKEAAPLLKLDFEKVLTRNLSDLRRELDILPAKIATWSPSIASSIS